MVERGAFVVADVVEKKCAMVFGFIWGVYLGSLFFGGGAGFAFFFDDFYGAENLLFEGLELVRGDTRAKGRGTHISMSIDAGGEDLPEGI